jgi:Family of unknown function (DUF5819)
MSPRAVLHWTIRASVLAGFLGYFALTFFYCFPNNPIKLQLRSVLQRTIGTYFAQNWSLFAPNPIQANQSLLVRCMITAEFDAAKPAKTLPKDGWNDITTPLFREHQQNRFSVYDRISRTHTNFIKAYMHGGGSFQALFEECRRGDRNACKAGNLQLADARARSIRPLVKVASSYCQEAGEPESSHVALRVREVPVAPWSRRDEGAPKGRDFELGVYPIDRDVVTTGVFQAGGS